MAGGRPKRQTAGAARTRGRRGGASAAVEGAAAQAQVLQATEVQAAVASEAEAEAVGVVAVTEETHEELDEEELQEARMVRQARHGTRVCVCVCVCVCACPCAYECVSELGWWDGAFDTTFRAGMALALQDLAQEPAVCGTPSGVEPLGSWVGMHACGADSRLSAWQLALRSRP
jgi:hypothetical protein